MIQGQDREFRIASEKMDIDHVYETLKMGIDTLATGTGSIQARLREAWLVIKALEGDDFPLELRDDFRKLSDALNTPPHSAMDAGPAARTVGQARADYEGLDDETHRNLRCCSYSDLFMSRRNFGRPTNAHREPQSRTAPGRH